MERGSESKMEYISLTSVNICCVFENKLTGSPRFIDFEFYCLYLPLYLPG